MANTYTLIASSTVGSGGAANIEFTSIPATYTDLLIKMSLRQGGGSDGYQLGVRFNSSTSNYSRVAVYGDGSTGQTAGGSSETFARFGFAESSTFTANTFGSYEMYIPNYTSSSYKSFSTNSVTESNTSSVYAQGLWEGLWSNTSVITSILLQELSGAGTSFVQYSTAYLYGIKNS